MGKYRMYDKNELAAWVGVAVRVPASWSER